MTDTVQRLGIEFFGKLDEKSLNDIADKIKTTFANKNISDIIPKLSANFATFANALKSQLEATTKAISDSTTTVAKIGAVVSDAGTKMGAGFGKASQGASELTNRTKALVTLTEKLAESFAKIDFRNMIKADQMELFQSKFVAINKQVEMFTAALAKIAKPNFTGIQQEALAMSTQIDAAIKALGVDVAGGKAVNTEARIQSIINMLKELKSIGGSALASEFKAGAESLSDFGVRAGMSTQEIAKLNLGLLELGKIKEIISRQVANTKSQFESADKTTEFYNETVKKLNKNFVELTKTGQSVDSVIKKQRSSLEEIVPVVGRLEAAFNLINVMDKINPPEIHRASEAWKASADNLQRYMQQLSGLMHVKLEDTDPMKHILMKSKEIESILEKMRVISGQQPTAEGKADMDAYRVSMSKLLTEYTNLERGMLGGAIQKTTASLKEFGIEAGMAYGKIRKIKIKDDVLEMEKAAGLLRTQLKQLHSEYQGLGAVTDANRVEATKISTEYTKVAATLGAVEQRVRVLKGGFADAARGLRMYWEGFAPMLKSQAAWLAGGAVLFGVMYKIQDAVKNFVAFEDRLNRIKIVGEGSRKEIAELRKGLLALAETTGQTTVELAEAAFYLVKYGLSVKQVNDVLPSLARLTTVAGGTIQENAKGVISLLNAYQMAYEDADKLANALTVTLNKSALEMADLSTILSTVASSGAQLHQPVEQILALSAAMSNLGVKPSTIGTSIRQFIGTLAQVEAPTQRFSDRILRKVTIALGGNEEALDALNPAYHSLVDILLVLNKAGITTHDMFAGLNLRAASGTAAMMNAKDSILDLVLAIRTQNILTAQFAQVTGSAEMSLKNLSNTLESTVTKILGGGTEQGLARFSQIIHAIIKGIGFLFEGIQGVIVRIGILAAGFIYLSKAIGGAAVSFTLFNRVITIAPWMKIVSVIAMIISGLQLLTYAWSSMSEEQTKAAENSKKELEGYADKRKELQSQITLNNQLAEANLADKTAIELKNAVLQREIELMKEKEKIAQKAQIRELAGPAGRALAGFMLQQQMSKFGKPPDESLAIDPFAYRALDRLGKQASPLSKDGLLKGHEGGPTTDTRWLEAMRKTPIDYDDLIKRFESDMSGEGQKIISYLKTLDEEMLKDQDADMQKLARYYIAREKAKISREEKVDSEEVRKHKRTMDALDAEYAALIKKNEALRETSAIQAQIDEQEAKLSIVTKDMVLGTDPATMRGLEEEEKKIGIKIKELELSKADAKVREADAAMDYYATIKKSAIDQEILTQNLERSAKVQAEITKLEIDWADIIAKQELLPNRREIKELQDLDKKRVAIELQLGEKKKELTKEEFAQAERLNDLRIESSTQYIARREQEIDQSVRLTTREKELQKLALQRMLLEKQIVGVLELISKADPTAIDVTKREALKKSYDSLINQLDLVNGKIEFSKNKQKTFWEAIEEYIASAKEAVESFGYTMGKVLVDQVQSAFAEFGKGMIYQNADTIKELRSQRDEDFTNMKEKYDESRQELEDNLANGKTTYNKYYEDLQKLDDQYHKDVNSAQKQFEKNMKDSLITISSLWEKFWRAMIDAAVQMMAQKAVAGIFSSLGGLFGGGTSTGWAQANATGGGLNTGTIPLKTSFHEGGYIDDLVKSFHNGGLNQNEVLIKALRSEYILNPRAVNSIGVGRLDHMNRTGEVPGREIRIINVVDPSSIPSLSPDDVVNIISYDVAKRGQTYQTITLVR